MVSTRPATARGREGARRPPAAIGVLMLETGFPRPVGDLGNPNGFDFPLLYERAAGATVARVVSRRAEGLVGPFVAAGERLIGRGACAIVTSCGFLALHQRALADALPVPVATSSLLQVAWANALLARGRRCGVITFDADALGPEHLEAVGAPRDTPIVGMPASGELRTTIDRDLATLENARVREEVIAAGRELLARDRSVGAVVLECTNLPPHAGSLRTALGLPVFDGRTLLEWLWRAHQR
ncbi:MAG: aspartate/glutamate racemase family protein [Burkholderiaceae bacterium]|nr:aspartate/glutamate racemase family protein [Burkholderiaceae bacterium]